MFRGSRTGSPSACFLSRGFLAAGSDDVRSVRRVTHAEKETKAK
jgi:hypothetical protein